CQLTDDGFIDEDSCYVPFWYTRTGVIVKWSLFLGLTMAIALYLLVGYLHAKKRLQKGLPPLAYHRWLVSRAERGRVDPRFQPPNATVRPYYYNANGQPIDMYTMPPPVYDPNTARPPNYEGPPPAGSTKANPSQWTESTQRPADEEYAAPPGPPP
ncbi:hypothetical protein B0T26DRAFT_619218, partial [Lasiosphaeria miniovina]